jgi:hypothetical protein
MRTLRLLALGLTLVGCAALPRASRSDTCRRRVATDFGWRYDASRNMVDGAGVSTRMTEYHEKVRACVVAG